MARVSLIYPSDGLCYKFARNRTRRIPLGLAYIAAALEKAGHEVKVVDGALHDLSVEETVGRAMERQPEFVGIGCTTPLYHQAVAMIDLIKKTSPGTVVIFGGPHVSALPEPTLNSSKADVVCIGEAEESVVAVIEHIQNNKELTDIPGIAYRTDTGIGHNQEYRLRLHQSKVNTVKAIDLNICPIPARHLFEWDQYMDYARDLYEPQTGTMFSRGCPGKCAFCGAADTLVRWRNTDNIIEELKMIQDMGIKNVFIMDDTYTNNKKRIMEISKRIIETGIKLHLSVQLRLDQLDKEVCDMMYASGIRYVGPGIESGNERIIKAIGKGPRESKEYMREKIHLLQQYDWRIRCSYVFGMVDETEEEIMETIEFAKELKADENAFSILVPYPDSPLWAIAKAKGQVDDYMDFSKFLYYHEVGCNLSAVSTQRLLELHEFAYEYVGNPAYALDDNSVSSGNRPHIPYLTSEAFRKFREADRKIKEVTHDQVDVDLDKRTRA
jgi:anaerobic magnesium-protoporphyrin IX monomethyl ester cyclase